MGCAEDVSDDEKWSVITSINCDEDELLTIDVTKWSMISV